MRGTSDAIRTCFEVYSRQDPLDVTSNLNWGLTDPDSELKTILLAPVKGFKKHNGEGFGSELPGNFGGLLMRIAYNSNSELYGPLQKEYLKGWKAGTDVWIHKNRMRGYQTALDLFLQENCITILLFSGVNSDQCILGNPVDAYFRGYDCIVVKDTTATSSAEGGFENFIYNNYGFVTDSNRVIAAAK